MIYNEGWGQVIAGYPEFGLTDRVRQLDPTRLIDSTSGWYDHGAGDYSVSSPLFQRNRMLTCVQGQPPLCQPSMRHPVLLNPVQPIRPLSHRIPRRIRWDRTECFH